MIYYFIAFLIFPAIYLSLMTPEEFVLANKNFKVFRILPSDITSLNHKDIANITLIKAISSMFVPFTNPWKVRTALKVKAKRQKLVFKGQGLGDTKWKGCAWKELLVKFVNLII